MSKEKNGDVIDLPSRKDGRRASEKKWGKPVLDLGFSIIPSLIFKAQSRLKLEPTQLALLLHLADFWWERSRKPWPSKRLLGERMGLSARQIQRYMAELEKMGLLTRVERYAPGKGRTTNEYDLSGLVNRLKELEPEFSEVEQRAKQERRAVTRPGLRKRHIKSK